jgi:hypothetical protein
VHNTCNSTQRWSSTWHVQAIEKKPALNPAEFDMLCLCTSLWLTPAGWPAQLSGFCPGSKTKPAACAADPCTSSAARNCSEGAAISCVSKTCPGTIMVGGFMYPEATCTPVYMDKATGLPVGSCKATDRALQRQQNRVTKATPAGQAAVAKRQQQTAQERSGARPQLANVDQALNTPVSNNRLRLADVLAQQTQQP